MLMNIEKIMSFLPHRYPMLLVDRVVEINGDEELVALKNVTINEDFFNGHFPGKPVMPGVLIIEALAQASGILVLNNENTSMSDHLVYFMSIDEAKFRKPVVPGDQLHLHVKKLQSRGTVWKMKCEAKVDGQKVAEAVLTAMIMEQ
jgi:3-hydroxyacyl-[acyl-carrier-protein] dehydratase